MLHKLIVSVLAFATLAAPALAQATYTLGSIIPSELKITDQTGKDHTFGDFRGQPLVLEWTNYNCPFVRKFYDSGALQKQQASAVAKGVTWLSVISSAEGKQGYLGEKEAPSAVAKQGFKGTAVIRDVNGELGRAFGANSTPTMAVIDSAGKLVYFGALDSIPSFNAADIPNATNYVAVALDEVLSGKTVTTPQTKAYGCSIKY